MPFKATARTTLQLGSELISYDAVIFNKLIKNITNNRSKKGVRIDVVVRIPDSQSRALRDHRPQHRSGHKRTQHEMQSAFRTLAQPSSHALRLTLTAFCRTTIVRLQIAARPDASRLRAELIMPRPTPEPTDDAGRRRRKRTSPTRTTGWMLAQACLSAGPQKRGLPLRR